MDHVPLRRPSPALVVSVLALFVALGGSGYAATRLSWPTAPTAAAAKRKPSRHACVAATVSLCPTLRRAVDAEFASLVKGLNVHSGAAGPPGPQGPRGNTGGQGNTGPPGPGATTFATQVAGTTTLATLGNGVTVSGACAPGNLQLFLATASGLTKLQGSGNLNVDGSASGFDTNNTTSFQTFNATSNLDVNLLVRDSSVSGAKFALIDIHGQSSSCNFWGMTIPSG